jgi:hypothetical protein
MKLRIVPVLLAAMLLVASAQPAGAIGQRRLFRRSRPAPRHTSAYPNYPYRYLNQYYPRYHGGFHERYFQSLGVPSGDIGPRGNGMYPTPW